MPVYEYRCTGCGHRFEKLGPISAQQEGVPCPTCGAARAQKLISLVAAPLSDGSTGAARSGGCCGGAGGCACRG